jgi:hypothetical protein
MQTYIHFLKLSSMRRSHAPVLTTTSLLLLRLCGKYVRLMRALQPIAASVMAAMVQLLEIYVIAVHNMFTKDVVRRSFPSIGLSVQVRVVVTGKRFS